MSYLSDATTTAQISTLSLHDALPICQETAAVINERRRTGGRVWAVGTTVVRTLETGAQPDGTIRAGAGDTALFIHAPYQLDRKSTRLNSSHVEISYAVFCLKKKNKPT